ncbi:MAG: hypothetical protein NT070_14340 [Cyanobacteria bacterium]|nr:hypothetical protein [Cyanobacteriota bacterium]
MSDQFKQSTEEMGPIASETKKPRRMQRFSTTFAIATVTPSFFSPDLAPLSHFHD